MFILYFMTTMEHIRLLESRLAGASPKECARLTKKIAALKDKFINGG